MLKRYCCEVCIILKRTVTTILNVGIQFTRMQTIAYVPEGSRLL